MEISCSASERQPEIKCRNKHSQLIARACVKQIEAGLIFPSSLIDDTDATNTRDARRRWLTTCQQLASVGTVACGPHHPSPWCVARFGSVFASRLRVGWCGGGVCPVCGEGGLRYTHTRAPRANSRPWRQLLTVPHTLALPCFTSQPGRRNVRRPTKAKKPKADPLYPARPRNFTIGNAVQVSPRLPPRAPCLLLPRHRRPVQRAALCCMHLCEWGGACERSMAGFAWLVQAAACGVLCAGD